MRIDHGTLLTPRGIFKLKIEEGESVDPNVFTEIQKEEEPKTFDLDFYRQKTNWLHLNPNILRQGRVVHQELKFPEDQELEDE